MQIVIEIETFLRGSNGDFVQVGAITSRPTDADYVEGAVRIALNGVEIIGVQEWDYVDQLWAYIASMVPRLAASGHASTYFPDQPIEISFRRQGERVLVSARLGKETRTSSAPMREFVSRLRDAGVEFFAAMSDLLPENSDAYQEARRELLMS